MGFKNEFLNDTEMSFTWLFHILTSAEITALNKDDGSQQMKAMFHDVCYIASVCTSVAGITDPLEGLLMSQSVEPPVYTGKVVNPISWEVVLSGGGGGDDDSDSMVEGKMGNWGKWLR